MKPSSLNGYTAHCEDTQRSRLSESESKKRKCVINEIEVKDDWISGAWNDTCTEKCFAKARFIGLDGFELQDTDSTETSDLESLITEVTASFGCHGTPSVDSSINIYGDDMVDSMLVIRMTGRVHYLSVPRTILHPMNPLTLRAQCTLRRHQRRLWRHWKC